MKFLREFLLLGSCNIASNYARLLPRDQAALARRVDGGAARHWQNDAGQGGGHRVLHHLFQRLLGHPHLQVQGWLGKTDQNSIRHGAWEMECADCISLTYFLGGRTGTVSRSLDNFHWRTRFTLLSERFWLGARGFQTVQSGAAHTNGRTWHFFVKFIN